MSILFDIVVFFQIIDRKPTNAVENEKTQNKKMTFSHRNNFPQIN